MDQARRKEIQIRVEAIRQGTVLKNYSRVHWTSGTTEAMLLEAWDSFLAAEADWSSFLEGLDKL